MTMADGTRLVAAGYVPAMRSSDEMHVESSMVATGPGYITNSGTPTDQEFETIRSNFGDPRANVKPTDYYAFRMIASGDGLDSYYTRQDVETSFTNFVRDLKKGQSVLGSHQMATFSYGSSFEGEVIPADENRSEYEGAFYPQWDTPDLRTRNWLIGNYYIGRGVTLNGQSSDDLIRSIELGSVRKASISFMVGQYLCGLDGHDLINTMFGPMPDDSCAHFPGVTYEGSVAWALMKHNTLVETSLVYKNASPSSMLLRKAETLAERGVLKDRDIQQLEGRFQVRLPRFERTLWTGAMTTATASNQSPVLVPVTTASSASYTAPTVALTSNGATTTTTTITGLEDNNMAGRRRGESDGARELARQALISDPEPEQEELTEATPEATASDEATTPDPEPTTDGETPTVPEDAPNTDAAADDTAAETPEPDASEAAPAVASEAAVPDASAAPDPEPDPTPEPTPEPAPEPEAVSEAADAAVAEEVTAPETPRTDDDVISAFVSAADALVSAMRRKPDSFGASDMDFAARAERSVDLALIDAGCDTTVGAHVARTFATRTRELDKTLGEPLTVEALRSLQSKATLGDTLYEELVKDAVAARSGVQGESYNAPKYRDLLLAARDVTYVKEEIASWKEAKRGTFQPGRSVIPRQVSDVKVTKEERKALPEPPPALPATSGKSTSPVSNIFEPRNK